MIKVKFHAPWRPDDYVRNWISKYTHDGNSWNNLILVDGDDYDFIAIFNYPKAGYVFDASRAIIFQGEPAPIRTGWGAYANPDPRQFFCLFDTPNHFNSVGWSFDASWRELSEMKIEKTRLLSGVISAKNQFIGQKRRLSFVINHLKKLKDYDHYGRGTGAPTKDKSDAIFPYRYTFNAENCYERNYYTEKLTDAIVGEALCFYDGCPNINDHYDPKAFIRLDLSRPEEAIEMLKNAILNDEWEKRIEAIRKEKHRVLNELQPMPLVESILKEKGVV